VKGGDENEGLIIGQVSLLPDNKKNNPKYIPFVGHERSPPPREVKAEMALLLKLQLNIEGDVTSTNNNNNDSLMQKIAHSPGSTTARKSCAVVATIRL
jgi:hypothetical protein